MFSFHEAPPPSRPWSAIIREPCASAPVSASSRQSRIAASGSARIAARRVANARRLRVVKSSPKSVSPARTSFRVCQPANTGGRGASPSPPASAPADSCRSDRSGSSRRVPPHRVQRTWTATISAPRRAVPASAASPPQRRQGVRCQVPSAASAAASTRAPAAASASGSHGAAVVRARKIANGFTSMPIAGRPSAAASIGATPDPQNGSSTRSPGAVAAAMRAATRSGGLRDQYLCSR